MEILDVDGTPHLCLFAVKDVKQFEELRYDYGCGELDWRKV
jgi:hypothetical protein